MFEAEVIRSQMSTTCVLVIREWVLCYSAQTSDLYTKQGVGPRIITQFSCEW